nr:hypothetical protein [uncultured Anaerocolumna sp.]
MNNNINFESLFENLEVSAETLDEVGSIEKLGFTKDQVRFINVLIENALKQYHKQLFTESL